MNFLFYGWTFDAIVYITYCYSVAAVTINTFTTTITLDIFMATTITTISHY